MPGGSKEGWTTLRLDVHDSNNRAEPNHVPYPKPLTCMDPHTVNGGSRSRTEILNGELFASSDQRGMHLAYLRVVQVHIGLAAADGHPGRSCELIP